MHITPAPHWFALITHEHHNFQILGKVCRGDVNRRSQCVNGQHVEECELPISKLPVQFIEQLFP